MRHRLLLVTIVQTALAAPAPPTGLRCLGGTAASITLGWNATADADLYDVQCGHGAAKPFVSYTTGKRTATIGQLKPAAALQCHVRAHRAAAPSIVDGWSLLSAAVPCATANDSLPQSAVYEGRGAARAGNTTRKVQMWRTSEYNYTGIVDYLANHDSGDLNGDAAVLSAVGFV
jgi:hypothetical protein